MPNLTSPLVTSLFMSHQGCQVCLHIGSDWPQMRQIWDFFRTEKKCIKFWILIWRSPRFVPFGGQSDPLLSQAWDPCVTFCEMCSLVHQFPPLPRFPADTHTLDIDRQFMLGPALLVSPVLDQVLKTYVLSLYKLFRFLEKVLFWRNY